MKNILSPGQVLHQTAQPPTHALCFLVIGTVVAKCLHKTAGPMPLALHQEAKTAHHGMRVLQTKGWPWAVPGARGPHGSGRPALKALWLIEAFPGAQGPGSATAGPLRLRLAKPFGAGAVCLAQVLYSARRWKAGAQAPTKHAVLGQRADGRLCVVLNPFSQGALGTVPHRACGLVVLLAVPTLVSSRRRATRQLATLVRGCSTEYLVYRVLGPDSFDNIRPPGALGLAKVLMGLLSQKTCLG